MKKKEKSHNENKGKKFRAMASEILPQHIMLKGTYFICNLYLYVFNVEKDQQATHYVKRYLFLGYFYLKK